MTNQTLQRLYLVTPRLGDTAAFVRGIGTALDAGDIAAILLRLDDADERTLIERVKSVASIVQRRDIAVILDGHPQIAVRAGADGAHLTGIEALTGALAALKPDLIAGAGDLRSRHDAMLAAEAGADYVMFGEPGGRGGRVPFAAVEDRIKWWAEVFQAPCVGYAASLDEVGPLAQAQADFVALGDWIWTDDQAATAVATASERIAAARAVAGSAFE
jgi:thiamine-phosphate pyrophosphorylase